MWPGVLKVEEHALFKTTRNFVTAGAAVKAADTMRKYTIDFGAISTLRGALVPLIWRNGLPGRHAVKRARVSDLHCWRILQ